MLCAFSRFIRFALALPQLIKDHKHVSYIHLRTFAQHTPLMHVVYTIFMCGGQDWCSVVCCRMDCSRVCECVAFSLLVGVE